MKSKILLFIIAVAFPFCLYGEVQQTEGYIVQITKEMVVIENGVHAIEEFLLIQLRLVI